jgi:hypothetical protein
MFALTRRGRPGKAAIGQRYRKRDAPLAVWEVSALFTGTDGVPYARLFRFDVPSMLKTVARATLESGLYYTPMQDRPAQDRQVETL